MTRPTWIAPLALALALAATTAAGGVLDLTAVQVNDLPEEAREHYEQAAYDYDHAYEDGGLRNLLEAASIAPDAIPLQFLAARMAVDRAEKTRGAEALEAIDAARLCYQRILESPAARERDTARAQTGLDALGEVMDEVNQRERRLREAGDTFLVQFSALQERIAASRAMRARERRTSRPQTYDGTGPNPLLPTSDSSRRSTQPDRVNAGSSLLPDADHSRRHNAPVIE